MNKKPRWMLDNLLHPHCFRFCLPAMLCPLPAFGPLEFDLRSELFGFAEFASLIRLDFDFASTPPQTNRCPFRANQLELDQTGLVWKHPKSRCEVGSSRDGERLSAEHATHDWGPICVLQSTDTGEALVSPPPFFPAPPNFHPVLISQSSAATLWHPPLWNN